MFLSKMQPCCNTSSTADINDGGFMSVPLPKQWDLFAMQEQDNGTGRGDSDSQREEQSFVALYFNSQERQMASDCSSGCRDREKCTRPNESWREQQDCCDQFHHARPDPPHLLRARDRHKRQI